MTSDPDIICAAKPPIDRHGADFGLRVSGDAETALRRGIQNAVSRNVGERHIDNVLDYGGDPGQILSEGPRRGRSVFELSGVEPALGSKRLVSEGAVVGRHST